jgi:hypothetical protein
MGFLGTVVLPKRNQPRGLCHAERRGGQRALLRAGRTLLRLVLGSAALAQAQTAAPSRIVDRVVAVVSGRALTQSELELEARIALIRGGGRGAASQPLENSDLRTALDYAVGQRLASDEADKLQAFPVEDADLQTALKFFKERIGGEAAYAEFLRSQEVDTAQVEAVLARDLRAERLLDTKVRLRARVSDSEVRRYYDEHVELHAKKFEDVQPQIRGRLGDEHYRQLVQQELAAARRTAEIRIVAPWARADAVKP